MNTQDVVECRRCGRALTARLAQAAGVGPLCALREAAEAAQRPRTAPERASAAQTVLALVAAFLYAAEDQVAPLLDDGDPRGAAAMLAAATAEHLQEDLPDGADRLRALAARWAREGC